MIKHLRLLAASLVIAAVAAGSVACGAMQYDDYAGPPYVVGHYTCTSPVTGMPDYCELLSDGTYQVVPFSIYNSAPYGSVLSYSHSHYTIVHTSVTRVGSTAPDVNYSSYRSAKRVSAKAYSASSYSGMSSYSNSGKARGVVVYGSNGGKSSYRSSGTSVYRASSGSRH